MKQIRAQYLVGSYDAQEFYNNVDADIQKLQAGSLEVEIQYQTVADKHGRVHYSALILGRS